MTTNRILKRNGALGAVLLSGALVLGACAAAEPGPPPVVEVTGVDYAYEGLPASVPVGTEFTFENGSSTEAHEMVMIRLPDDETRTVGELLADPDALPALFPLVDSVLLAPPNADGIAVVGNGVLTEPGRYAVICVIPTGADPDEYMAAAAASEGGPPQVAGGPPHAVNGMFGEVVVEP